MCLIYTQSVESNQIMASANDRITFHALEIDSKNVMKQKNKMNKKSIAMKFALGYMIYVIVGITVAGFAIYIDTKTVDISDSSIQIPNFQELSEELVGEEELIDDNSVMTKVKEESDKAWIAAMLLQIFLGSGPAHIFIGRVDEGVPLLLFAGWGTVFMWCFAACFCGSLESLTGSSGFFKAAGACLGIVWVLTIFVTDIVFIVLFALNNVKDVNGLTLAGYPS